MYLLIGLSTVFIAFIIFNKSLNRTIHSEIIIEDSPDKVWNTLMNFESYPEWNPFISAISGKAEIGNSISMTLQLPNKNPILMKPIIQKLSQNDIFQWKGSLGITGIFDGTHSFGMQETANGHTQFIHSETFRGIASGLVLLMIRKDTATGFKAMNVALKQRVEI